MKRTYFLIIFVLLSALFFQKSFTLNAKNIKSVTITHNLDNPPFKFVNDEGRSDGILIDIWKLWSVRTGIEVEFVPASWDSTLSLVKNGKVDIHAGLFYSEERSKYFDFTKDIKDVKYDYFISNDSYSKSLNEDDIAAYRIGVPKGFTESYIRENNPDQTLAVFDDYPELFDNATAGKIKIFVSPEENLKYYLSSNHLENQYSRLKFIKGYDRSYLGGIKKGRKELLKEINSGLDKISDEEIENIVTKWFDKIEVSYSFTPINNGIVKFTKEEKEWLERNKELTFGADFKWPPFDFVDKNDEHTGLSSDYLKIIQKQTGIKINVVPGVWSYVLKRAIEGKIDGITASVRTKKREEYLSFSEPFIEVPLVIITQTNNNEIKGFNDLKDKIIAVNKDSYIHEYILKHKLDVYITLRSSNKECLEAVSYGKADAYIGNLSVYTFIVEEDMITNLKMVDKIPGWSAPISIAVLKKDTIFLGIINKVLNNVSEEQNIKLRNKWFAESIQSSRIIKLSRREQEWLTEHPVIKVCGDPDWPPNAMYDKEGKYIGIIADLWELIEKKSGIQFKRIRSENWGETLNLMKEGEVDVIDGVSETPERSEFMDYSDVLFTSQVAIIGRNDQDFISGLNNIGDLKLGVQESASETELIKKKYPNIQLYFYQDPDDAYQDLASRKIDLFLRHYSDFQYSKKELMLTSLKVVGMTEFSRDYKIGVSKYNIELLSIINKSLANISLEEKNKIFEKWHGTEEFLIDYSLVWKVALSALVILLLIFYWNRRLSHEIELRKRTEIELEKAKDIAIEAASAKSEFLANMSHEIRTPMNAVIGFTELMEKTTLTNKQRNYISTIKAGGSTLLNLINDILDISKIEANKIELLYSGFNLSSTIFELDQLFGNTIKEKGLDFIIEQDPDFPKNIILDESRLRQIFFNIISNSIKFTDTGYIKISTKYTKVKAGVINFIIILEDTGIGIKEDQLSKIFDSFVQVGDSKAKRALSGTGLGLTITKRLVELMNGSIKVESQYGSGTKFTIEFYKVRVDGTENEINIADKNIENVIFDRIKVLIVDDVESNRMLLKEFCEEHNFEIIEAENGKEAIDKAKLHVPDMILMDIRMPIMDGYEAIKNIKEDENLERIPIIAVTASVMASESAKIERSKFNGYIRKPISRNELINKFKEFIPYKTEIIESEELVFKDELLNSEEFFTQLNENIYEEYKNSISKQNIEDIRRFADELFKLSEKHHSGTIMNYSKQMLTALNNLDIDAIKKLLMKYESILKKITGDNNG